MTAVYKQEILKLCKGVTSCTREKNCKESKI